MSSSEAAPSLFELIVALCGSFELAVSKQDVEIWLGQEAEFQKLVTGRPCEPLTTGRRFRGLRPFVSEISSLKRLLGQHEQQVASLEQPVAGLKIDVANLRSTLSERESSLDQLRVINSSLSVELTKRNEQLNGVLQSAGMEIDRSLARFGKTAATLIS